MKVDSHIVNAIQSYLNANKITKEQFAEQMGVSNAAITKWLRVGNGITQARWIPLFQLLKQYLPNEKIFLNDSGEEQYSSAAAKQSAYFFEPKYIPLIVPTFTLEELANYDDTLESILQFSKELKAPDSEYRPKHKNMSSVFAVEIQGDMYAPVFPNKTKLFVSAGSRPEKSALVLVLPKDAQTAILGKYQKDNGQFSILTYNDGKTFSGKIKDAKTIFSWVFPVLYYEVITF